jgi:hypothetical protein
MQFSARGLTVACSIAVLATLANPAAAAAGAAFADQYFLKVDNIKNKSCEKSSPDILVKIFHWNNSTNSRGEIQKQQDVAAGKKGTFVFEIIDQKPKYRYMEVRAYGTAGKIAKSVLKMKPSQGGVYWNQFDGYEGDNFNINKKKSGGYSFNLDVKMKVCP